MRPDWYDFSVDVAPDSVISGVVEGLAETRGGAPVPVAETVPPRFYGKQVRIDAGGSDSAVRVAWGGQNVTPHVWASGEVAARVCAIARQKWPGAHYVSRVDACEDFRDPLAFKRLSRTMRSIARRHSVQPSVAGDWLLKEHGRSLYLGAVSSPVRARMYEKGLQMQGTFPKSQRRAAALFYPADYVRLELQVRPKTKEAKLLAGTIEPHEMWGFSSWSQDLLRNVEGIEVPRYQVGVGWRPSDDDRAFRFMCQQYGKLLSRVRDDLGDWKAVGMQIGQELADIEKARI